MIDIKLPEGTWRYDPTRPLGNPGGFGAVFYGSSPSGQPVAIKRLHLNTRDAAHRELAIAAEISGRTLSHVMPILDAGQDADSDSYFLVMPIAECSLDDHIHTHGTLSEREAIEILLSIATGLQSVGNIVHRDLKPGNVLLHDGSWKIADFGIARFVQESTSARTLKDCLSPQFAAPEQWRLEHATPATDIYALGCIAHVLLTGAPPFAGSVADLQSQHLGESPPALSDVGPGMATLTSMMLRKVPAARPTIARVRLLLEQMSTAKHQEDSALERIALAAAEHERDLLAAEANKNRARSETSQRQALASEAQTILRSLFRELADRVQTTVPNARISQGPTAWTIEVATVTLVMEVITAHALERTAFPRSGWDVVFGAAIQLTQTKPRHQRAASLWYTRQNRAEADYRWYEVGYSSNPLSGRGFEFEPVALERELADQAHAPGMGIVQTAYAAVPIDDEHSEGFYRRWTNLFALACEGRLQFQTHALPTF